MIAAAFWWHPQVNNNASRIFAWGNYYRSYPAYWNECIAVGATGETDEKSYYSNYGDWVDVTAPGGSMVSLKENGIISTLPTYPDFFLHTDSRLNYSTDYDYLEGTSMSAPYVTGLAGLILSQWPALTQNQVRERILATVDDVNYLNVSDLNFYTRDSLGAGIKPAIIFSSVVLPDPDGPRRVRNSPAFTCKSVGDSASTSS